MFPQLRQQGAKLSTIPPASGLEWKHLWLLGLHLQSCQHTPNLLSCRVGQTKSVSLLQEQILPTGCVLTQPKCTGRQGKGGACPALVHPLQDETWQSYGRAPKRKPKANSWQWQSGFLPQARSRKDLPDHWHSWSHIAKLNPLRSLTTRGRACWFSCSTELQTSISGMMAEFCFYDWKRT